MRREHYILVAVNAAYLVPLIIKFLIEGNWEFLAYTAQVVGLLILLLATLHKTHYPLWLLSMLAAWAALHMAGGAVHVGGEVLYALHLIDITTIGGDSDGFILRYDQVVHFYGFFTATFAAYWLLLPHLKPGFRRGAVAFVALLAGMGFGAINEIIEFAATLIDPNNGVGGYLNTSLDLVSNALGALSAALIIAFTTLGDDTVRRFWDRTTSSYARDP
jgi:uncharacterized membrane protein YjdF